MLKTTSIIILVGLYVLSLAGSVASAPPTGDFLSAALADDGSLTGKSISLRYIFETSDMPPTPRARFDTQYIRTPKWLYVEVKRYIIRPGKDASLTETIKSFYDLDTKDYRTVGTIASTGQKVYKWALDSRSNLFTADDTMDISHGYISSQPLYQAVTRGTVAEEQQTVDGSQCWEVTITDGPVRDTGPMSWTVSLDPQIGFRPRQIVMRFTDHNGVARTITKSLRDYKQYGDGMWLPTLQVIDYGIDPSTPATVTLESVQFGLELQRENYEIAFPSGAEVYMLPLGETITIP